MSVPSLPDFERAIRLSQGNLDAAELAECHGLLCGLLCRETSGTANDFMSHLAAMQLVVTPGAALEAVMTEAFESSGQLDALSEEAKEAIEDLQQIARAEISSPGPDADESEEDEVAFTEIVEYVRVVALMMREDFRGPGQDEAIH
jgi:uncharacterized protein YgfB (UPF0149 family)